MAALLWVSFQFYGDTGGAPGYKWLEDFVALRLERMEPVLAEREWLAGSFSIADILMADVLRLVDRFDKLAQCRACRDYVARDGAPGIHEGARGSNGALRRSRLSSREGAS
jgi:glutathione S-transferase